MVLKSKCVFLNLIWPLLETSFKEVKVGVGSPWPCCKTSNLAYFNVHTPKRLNWISKMAFVVKTFVSYSMAHIP